MNNHFNRFDEYLLLERFAEKLNHEINQKNKHTHYPAWGICSCDKQSPGICSADSKTYCMHCQGEVKT